MLSPSIDRPEHLYSASLEKPEDWTCSRQLGRPSAYHTGRGEEIIAIMRRGYSVKAAASAMKVHRDTIYDWASKYPEFAEAFEIAKGLRVYKFEADLMAAPDMVTVRRSIVALEVACPDEWNRIQRRS